MFKFLVLLFLCLLFFQPDKGIAGAKEGLLLWYNAILPAQLPFVIGVRLFMKSLSFDKISPILFNFASGLIAGYPVGSMTTAQLYRQGCITKENITALAAFSNMAGPLFVLGTIGTVLFQNRCYGYILLANHWLTAAILFCSVMFRERKIGVRSVKGDSVSKKQTLSRKYNESESVKKQAFGNLIGDAVGEASLLMLKIAGFIVLFSVLKQWSGGAIGALLELSGGVRWMIGQDIGVRWKLVGCSFLINFSGGCVILQSLGTMEECPISALGFVGWKVVQGILAAGIMLVICQFLFL